METMKTLFKFGCGDLVQDKLTKARGIITVRAEYRSGNICYHVAPKKLEAGKPAPGFWLDEGGLKLITKSNEKRPEREFIFELGDEVEHIDSDCKGVVVSRSDHLHQCLRYEVQSRELTKEGKLYEPLFIAGNLLKLVKSAKKEKAATEPVLERTGCSMRPPSQTRSRV